MRSFVAIDFETTGTDPATDRIIEVGAVRYENGVEVAAISQLIDPETAIPLRISNLTGILPAMVKGKPTIKQIAPQLKELLGDLPVVAHNAAFDMGFLQAAFAGVGLRAANPAYCTAELSRVVLPRAKNHRLATLVQQLDVALERHHRAVDDARACGEIYLKLIEQVRTMDPGLLRFILNLGEPGNWPLAPIFRQTLEEKEARGEKGKALMDWIRPYDGQLHQPEEQPPEGEPSAIDPEKVLGVLGPGGVISDAFPSYEHRPAQMEMALAVTQAFNKGSHLLMEAGTGTGKSLAYLMPAIAWAKRNGEKVAIATHTINLQEQLWEKDIPFLMDALTGTKWEGFKAALVKGRPNYICLRKWEEGVIGADFLSSPEERSFQIRLASWLSETETGDKAELNFASDDEKLWTDVQSEAETCLGPRCKWYRNHCFAYRARRRARDADLMVLNHAMLFADINTGNEILPAYRHLILDEAHHVEDVATNALGIRLENWEVFSALIHLFRSAGQGFLPTIRRKIPPEQRIAARPPVGLPSEDHIDKLMDLTMASKTACDELFRLCATLVETKGGSEEEAGRALRLTDYTRMGALWEALDASRANAVFRLKQLGQGMQQLAEAVEAMEPPLRDAESVLVDIQKQSGILIQSAKHIDGVLLKPADDVVTWIEVGTRRDSPRVVLRSAPIDVGDLLEEKLFDKLRSVVMTSATLSVSGGFTHVRQRLGLANLPPSRVSEGIMSSPFAYRRQALLLIPEDLPNPKLAGDKEFTRAVREFVGEYVVRAGGRTLVLFTSHRQLRQVYAELKDHLESEGIFLLGQGLDGARGRLVEEFKTAEKAVLFGSASFWEGVDIPGDGLTSVILVKLPFSPPDEPVMEARTEDLQRRGMSSFAHLSLPQAVIKFKQGFGRLVRTKSDRGVVIVLDNRISPRQTRYGSQFLKSLPGPSVYAGPIQSVMERALAWLKLEDDV